jgi:hypothetical protein
MTDFNDKLATQWNDASNLVLGVWLAISPWVLSYASHTAAAWNAHAVGVIVAVAAIAALISFQKWEEWVNTALGAWLVISPFILGFTALAPAFWAQLVTGILIGLLGLWAVMSEHERLTTRS